MTNPITEERLREIEETHPDLAAEVRRLQSEITGMKWACEECMRTRVKRLDKALHSLANEFCVRLKVGPVEDVIKHHLEVAE